MDAKKAQVLAAFAVALYTALIVFGYGFVSLLTDAEVIPSAEAGRIVGPAMVGATAATLLVHLALALRHPSTAILRTVLLAALVTWLAALVVGGVGFAFATGQLIGAAIFTFGQAVGVFGLLIPLLAAVVSWVAVLVARAEAGGSGRPRWPWERDDE